MKVLVAVKRVVDYNVKVRVKADGTGVETANVKMSMNPFDEIGVEEAVRLKEKRQGDRSDRRLAWSSTQCQETIRTALAMGADRGIHVQHRRRAAAAGRRQAAQGGGRQGAAAALHPRQAGDRRRHANQTGQMLAALLGWAQGTFASKIWRSTAMAPPSDREVDGGLETIQVKLPAGRSRPTCVSTSRAMPRCPTS